MNLSAWVSTWGANQVPVGKVVNGVDFAFNGHRRKSVALLGDPWVRSIVVDDRDRLRGFGAEYLEAALSAQGRRELVVVESGEVGGDSVCEMTEVLAPIWARWCGKRAAANRARRAVDAAAATEGGAA